jgi:hypothetical protein
VKVSGDDYIDGASERIGAAYAMYTEYRFIDAIYLAGVAVECILRAFTSDDDDEFEGRHDLRRLMKAATLERFVGEKQRQAISAALGEVDRQEALWADLRRHLAADRLHRIVSILTMTPDEVDDDVRAANG